MKKKSLSLLAAILLALAALLPACPAGTAGEVPAGVTAEEYRLERDGKTIYGRLYLPENTGGPIPLLILSHGLGSDHTIMEPYAEAFAERGFAAYIFDYIGGSEHSLIDGSFQEMSVLTEAEDLNRILDHFLGDSRFAGIFLFGGSQGGFVSACVAGTRPADVAGLVLLYPALNLQEISLAMIPEDGRIPDTVVIGGHTVGRVYLEDMRGFDIYAVLGQYTGPALLFHGTEDPYVPESYSRRAAETLPDAELVIVEGAGHGFRGDDLIRVAEDTAAFVRRVTALPAEDAA